MCRKNLAYKQRSEWLYQNLFLNLDFKRNVFNQELPFWKSLWYCLVWAISLFEPHGYFLNCALCDELKNAWCWCFFYQTLWYSRASLYREVLNARVFSKYYFPYSQFDGECKDTVILRESSGLSWHLCKAANPGPYITDSQGLTVTFYNRGGGSRFKLNWNAFGNIDLYGVTIFNPYSFFSKVLFKDPRYLKRRRQCGTASRCVQEDWWVPSHWTHLVSTVCSWG